MKKVLSLVIAIVMVASLAASAFATASPTPSASLQVPDIVGVVSYDKDGNVVEIPEGETLTVNNVSEKDEIEPEVMAALEEAYESLKTAGSVAAVVPERADMTVYDIFSISASEGIAAVLANGGTVTVTLDMKVEPGTEMDAIVYKDGKWSLMYEDGKSAVTVEANGDVNLTINQLGIFAVLVK